MRYLFGFVVGGDYGFAVVAENFERMRVQDFALKFMNSLALLTDNLLNQSTRFAHVTLEYRTIGAGYLDHQVRMAQRIRLRH